MKSVFLPACWTALWPIKRIQKIRNLIVHQGGKLRDHDGNLSQKGQEVKDFMNKIKFLSGDNEIVLEEGFLAFVITSYKNYFKLIAESINARENS